MDQQISIYEDLMIVPVKRNYLINKLESLGFTNETLETTLQAN